MRIFILNGPNLNLLGVREPEVYGSQELRDIERRCRERTSELRMGMAWLQSNSEGELIDALHSHRDWDGVIINAAAYTHTSLAIADAIAAIRAPTIEVHLSNIHAREPIRRTSLIAPVVWGQVSGFGYRSYIAAIDLLYDRLSEAEQDA